MSNPEPLTGRPHMRAMLSSRPLPWDRSRLAWCQLAWHPLNSGRRSRGCRSPGGPGRGHQNLGRQSPGRQSPEHQSPGRQSPGRQSPGRRHVPTPVAAPPVPGCAGAMPIRDMVTGNPPWLGPVRSDGLRMTRWFRHFRFAPRLPVFRASSNACSISRWHGSASSWARFRCW